MRMLVLGGTAWLGGELTRQALAAGHDVTCLARGESGAVPGGARLVVADRTDPLAYAALPAREAWDLVVDLARQPGQVRGALAALADRVHHWAFVSTGSVYADHSTAGAGTDAALLPPLESDVATPEEYGRGKVACEQACRAARGEALLVARSGLLAGYGDPSDRVGYWPGRFALAREDGGPVLVPERRDASAQLLDVVDLASWLLRAGLSGLTGTVDAYGPRRVLGDVLDAAQRVSGFTGAVVPVSDADLVAAGVEEYMGRGTIGSLPLWLHDPDWAGFGARSTASAQAAGLTARGLDETLADALGWERELGLARTGRRAGLDREDELVLVSER
jgi:2'-hydroxyisoflavone reductase